MDIHKISKEIHANAVNKGFWPKDQNIGEKLMLIVSELSEAMEAHRNDNFCKDISKVGEALTSAYSYPDKELIQKDFIHIFEAKVKDKFEDELADTAIRLFDLAEAMNIDLSKHIWLKMSYNKTREYLHGKKY